MNVERRIKELTRLAAPVCAGHGVELVLVTWKPGKGGAVARVMIDREEGGSGKVGQTRGSGVSLDDCTQVSRDLSSVLDMHEDLFPSFRLEVSSPGLDRPLVTPEHFKRFIGETIKVRLEVPFGEPPRRKFQGPLRAFSHTEAGEVVELEHDGVPTTLPFALIAAANIVPSF